MRILVAEDERNLNRILTEALTDEGYSVDPCFDGQEAWDALPAEDGEERWADSLWLREELGRLDDRSRTVILLKFYEDMTFREIAQVLRKPESTVKSDYYRGMNQLKERTTQI